MMFKKGVGTKKKGQDLFIGSKSGLMMSLARNKRLSYKSDIETEIPND